MAEVTALALSFPSVVYTVLLGVVLVYWMFVMVGAVHIGEGSEGALDGFDGDAALGASKGSMEGAAKGVLEAHASDGFAVDGHGADGADAADGAGTGNEGASVLAALVSALRLRAVPATVALSILVTFAWLVSMVGMQLLAQSTPAQSSRFIQTLVFTVAPFVSLPLSGLVLRPLAKVFVQRHAPTKLDMIGKTCVIRTGSVTHKFGEGTLEDGGAGLVLRVRVDGAQQLKRGDQALIVDWDAEREMFLVEPLKEMLGERK